MLDIVQFLSSKPICEAKTESKTHGDSNSSHEGFDKILQGAKDSINPMIGQATNRNKEQNKAHFFVEDEIRSIDDTNINHYLPLNAYNWANHLTLAEDPTDEDLLDLQTDEILLHISDSSHEESIISALPDDVLIAMENQAIEVSSEDEHIINENSPKSEQISEFDAFLHKEADFPLRELIDSREASASSQIPEADTETLVRRAKPGTGVKELEYRKIAEAFSQTKISSEDVATNKTFDVREGEPILSEVRIMEPSNLVDDKPNESFLSEEETQEAENEGLEGFGLVGNNLKDMTLDFSKVLIKQDSIEQAHIIDQLANKAIMTLGQNGSEMEIQIKPEHLGKIVLKIALEDGVFTGSIYTTNNEVKEFVQSNIEELKTSLKEQGFVFTSLDVDVGSQSNPNDFNHFAQVKPRIGKGSSTTHFSELDAEKLKTNNSSMVINNLSQVDYLA